jgi:hypothetical protein
MPGRLLLFVALLCAPQEEVPTFGTTVVMPSGLRGDIYYLEPYTQFLPRLEKMKPVGVIYTSSLYIPPRVFTDGFPGVTTRFEWFAIDYRGRFWIDLPGKYNFRLVSDDGSKLYIDDKRIIDNDGIHPPLSEDATVKLAGGIHTIRVSYFQGPGTGIALMLGVQGPDDKDFRAFSTERFKPPAHPEDWKFGDPKKP